MVTKPTRITDHSATLIDHIFFNSLEYYTVSGNIIYDISDHLPNFVLIDNANIQNKSKKSSNVTIQIVTGMHLLKTSKWLIGLIIFILAVRLMKCTILSTLLQMK